MVGKGRGLGNCCYGTREFGREVIVQVEQDSRFEQEG